MKETDRRYQQRQRKSENCDGNNVSGRSFPYSLTAGNSKICHYEYNIADDVQNHGICIAATSLVQWTEIKWINELNEHMPKCWLNHKIWYHILAIGWVLYLCTYAVPSVHINPLTGVKIKMAIIPVVTSSWIKRILYTFRINFIRMLLSEKDEPNPWGRASSSTLPLSFPPIVSNNDNNYVKFL